jgi:hypothetical protein
MYEELHLNRHTDMCLYQLSLCKLSCPGCTMREYDDIVSLLQASAPFRMFSLGFTVCLITCQIEFPVELQDRDDIWHRKDEKRRNDVSG